MPLFVEELTKTLVESGILREEGGHMRVEPLPPLTLPASLQDSLLARLNRSTHAKEVAQVGAVIGREFSYELLAAVAALPEKALWNALADLAGCGLVFCRGVPPDANYRFKHALVQEVAYSTLLKSRRQQLHARVAAVLETRFAETAGAQPELLAHHCTEARLVEKAIAYWHRAGQLATRRSALQEGIAQLHTGLALISDLSDGPERCRTELDLQITLGVAMTAARGQAASETGRAYARARELCVQLGGTRQLFPVLYGLWSHHETRAELFAARAVAEELLGRAVRQDDTGSLLIGYRALGTSLLHLGEPKSARAQLERALALYDPAQHRSLADLYSQDPHVAALSWLSCCSSLATRIKPRRGAARRWPPTPGRRISTRQPSPGSGAAFSGSLVATTASSTSEQKCRRSRARRASPFGWRSEQSYEAGC